MLSHPVLIGSLGLIAALLAVASSTSKPPQDAPAPACKLENIPVPALSVQRLDPAQFDALHKAIAPHGAAERWAEIPWLTDLAHARQKATQEHKPLLMWVMDGHPLGCT